MTAEELRRIIPRDEKRQIISARMRQLDRMLCGYSFDGRELELIDLEIRLFIKKLQNLEKAREARARARLKRTKLNHYEDSGQIFSITQ